MGRRTIMKKKLNRALRNWGEEIAELKLAIAEREYDLKNPHGDLDSEQLLHETGFLLFQLVVLEGQVRTALQAKAALDNSALDANWNLFQEADLGSSLPLIYRSILEFNELFNRLNQSEEMISLDSLFEHCCDLRKIIAFAMVMQVNRADSIIELGNKVKHRAMQLQSCDLLELRDSLREMLSEFWIYQSIGTSDLMPFNGMYKPLFELAELTGLSTAK